MKFMLTTLVSALIIASVAHIGKRYAIAGSLLLALPITSILAIIFLYLETQDVQKISQLSYGVFWLVLPTLLFFLILPALLKSGLSFWPSLALSSVAMLVIFVGYSWLARKFGIQL